MLTSVVLPNIRRGSKSSLLARKVRVGTTTLHYQQQWDWERRCAELRTTLWYAFCQVCSRTYFSRGRETLCPFHRWEDWLQVGSNVLKGTRLVGLSPHPRRSDSRVSALAEAVSLLKYALLLQVKNCFGKYVLYVHYTRSTTCLFFCKPQEKVLWGVPQAGSIERPCLEDRPCL